MGSMLTSSQPNQVTLVEIILMICFFAFCIVGLFLKIRDVESREGIWYCKDLKMQVSLTDPNDSFLMHDGAKIQCRCEMYYAKHTRGILEVYSNEWEHPEYIYGKMIFKAQVQEYNEMSMVVYHRKTKNKYTFVRTDKIA